MAKPGRLPNFRKMYPEASEEVIEVLRETERKTPADSQSVCQQDNIKGEEQEMSVLKMFHGRSIPQ